jgi:hypothetical protein
MPISKCERPHPKVRPPFRSLPQSSQSRSAFDSSVGAQIRIRRSRGRRRGALAAAGGEDEDGSERGEPELDDGTTLHGGLLE